MNPSESSLKAKNKINNEVSFPYQGNSPELTPIIEIKVSHDSFPKPIQVKAKVDTGFPGAFIMSETMGKQLKELYRLTATGTENLAAIGVFTVFCEVFPLAIQLPKGKWFKVNAFLPQGTDLGNVVGMELLRTVNICFKGTENKLLVTSPRNA